MTSHDAPPRWLRAIAARLVARDDREFLLDDLDDAYAARRARGRSTRVWYLAQALHAGITRRDRDHQRAQRTARAGRRPFWRTADDRVRQ